MGEILSHRGFYDNNTICENTIRAFDESILNNYGVELDVRLTLSSETTTGDLVVFHDHSLERMTDGRFKNIVYKTKFSDLKKIRLLDGSRIPTLDEVVSVIKSKRVLIEVKCMDIYSFNSESYFLNVCKNLVKILDKYKLEASVISFNHIFLQYFYDYINNKDLKSNITIGLLLGYLDGHLWIDKDLRKSMYMQGFYNPNIIDFRVINSSLLLDHKYYNFDPNRDFIYHITENQHVEEYHRNNFNMVLEQDQIRYLKNRNLI